NPLLLSYYTTRAMQILAPDSFCPLTDPQPYQREQDERRRPRPRLDNMASIVATLGVDSRRGAVRSIAWLGQLNLHCSRFSGGPPRPEGPRLLGSFGSNDR